MINSSYSYIRTFVMWYELDLIKTKPCVMQCWIYNTNEMCKKAEKRLKSVIRRYCECWNQMHAIKSLYQIEDVYIKNE